MATAPTGNDVRPTHNFLTASKRFLMVFVTKVLLVKIVRVGRKRMSVLLNDKGKFDDSLAKGKYSFERAIFIQFSIHSIERKSRSKVY